MEIRSLIEADFEPVLALNDAEVEKTSRMTRAQLRSLAAAAAYSRVAVVRDTPVAFVIALREQAPYENDNYQWFAARFPHFLYIDRIVVNRSLSGKGIGSLLYRDLFAFAKAQGISTVTCEYNLSPPNLQSRAFHNKFGFKQLATRWIADGSKQVSLQAVTDMHGFSTHGTVS